MHQFCSLDLDHFLPVSFAGQSFSTCPFIIGTFLGNSSSLSLFIINQGSPIPGLRTGTGPWPVRNRAAQQEVSGGRASKAAPAAPHRSPSLASPPEPSSPYTSPWKNCLARNQSLVPKRLGTAVINSCPYSLPQI